MSYDQIPYLKMSDIDKLTADITSDEGPGKFAKEFNQNVIDAFRATGGKLTGELEGASIILVTMFGLKSGKERTCPLALIEAEGRLFIVASRGGCDKNPGWYDNIVANPLVTVEYGTEVFRAKAVALQAEERDRIFSMCAEINPRFAGYQARTSTTICPVASRRRSAATRIAAMGARRGSRRCIITRSSNAS